MHALFNYLAQNQSEEKRETPQSEHSAKCLGRRPQHENAVSSILKEKGREE